MDFILSYWPIMLIIFLALVIITVGYVKAPPDTAFIISGLRKKIIIGKASIRIPGLERLDKLSLKLIPVDVKTQTAVPTADYINITVDAAVNVKISDTNSKLALAAQNFLNQKPEYIRQIAKEVLEGNMREIVGRMRLEEMVSDRQKFAELVKENAEPDLAAMGLDIISFNVQNFADNNGVIDDLGIDNISQIKKKAAIAKAEADKEIAIAQSEADRQANEARVNSQREISKKENELAIERARLKESEDTAKAKADAAYLIQEQEQRKEIEISTANADIAKQEKEVDIKQKEAQVMEESLNATIKKQADAELYRRQKQAEAEKYETERKAEAELLRRQKEAEGIRVTGQAEADAIRQKGLAEADAMQKKAEAYEKYGKAAIAEMVVSVLPEIASSIAEPLTKIDRISIIGGDSSGVSSVAGNVPAVMARTFESVKEATGVDLTSIVNASSYDAKVNRNISLDPIPSFMQAAPSGPSTPELKDLMYEETSPEDTQN